MARKKTAVKDIKEEEYVQTTILDFLDKPLDTKEDKKESEAIEEVAYQINDKAYDKIPEGAIVRNIYTNKDYKVQKTSYDNTVEVFSKETGFHTFARSDVKVMVNITG